MLQRYFGLLVAIGVFIYCSYVSIPVFAQTIKSNNYTFSESTLGQGGLPSSSSANYQGRSSTGDVGVGLSSSTNYGVQGGSVTPKDPTLAFIVNDGSVDLPPFSATSASMGSATFSVLNYTSFGYIVIATGGAPTYASHTIDPMPVQADSAPGTEQFGINLVANTLPQTIGAYPNNDNPTGFGFGSEESGYELANKYKYVEGDTIASAPKSSGKTDYTISYLVNVNGVTPGGKYTSDMSLIVVGTY